MFQCNTVWAFLLANFCFIQLWLIYQPLGNFYVTGPTAHPLPLPVSDILIPWSCCDSSLTKQNVNSFSPTHSYPPSLSTCKENIPILPAQIFSWPFSFSCPANSGHFIFRQCQGHPGRFLLRLMLHHTGISAQFAFLDFLMDICQILLLRLCFLFADANSLISLPCSASLSPGMASPGPYLLW